MSIAVGVAATTMSLTGCGNGGPSPAAPATAPSARSVAATFHSPPAWPGLRWTLAWPLGTRASDARHARQYLRDPRKVLHGAPVAAFEPHASLPPSAHPSGYRTGNVELWTGADADRYVYLVDARDHSVVERWPRSDPMTLCS